MAGKEARRRKNDASVQTLPAPTLARRLGWIALLGAWLFAVASLVSFDLADPPSPFVAPANDPVANWCGPVGAFIAWRAYFVLGVGVWVPVLAVGSFLGITATGRVVGHAVVRGVGVIVMIGAVSALHALLLPDLGPVPPARGGLVGHFLASELAGRFSVFGSFLLLFATFWVGAIVAADELVLRLPRLLLASLRLTRKIPVPPLPRPRFALAGASAGATGSAADATGSGRLAARLRRKSDAASIDPDAGGLGATEAFDPEEHELRDDEDEAAEADVESEDSSSASAATSAAERRRLSREELKAKIAKLPVRMAGDRKAVARDEDIPREPAAGNYEDYKFPTLDLLEDPETNYSEKMEQVVREQAEVLEEALQTYNIDGEVVGIESGPVVTLYSVQLAPGTKVAKVSAVSSDLARSLKAQNVRIVPNIAGTSAIGIEVPNRQKERVRLKELMSGGHADKMSLPMFLGKDASGDPLVADLARMPHMLIAGTTGSGKSVCINTIIMSWLYTKRPDELKLVLVDPKMVELSQFADVPHLMCPVVTEMSKAAAILEWACNKMEERYELLREAMVRDIASYNALGEEELYERLQPANESERAQIPLKLPYMVFIIDELADLIMTNKEVEHSIVRVAQKARAVGIHLILATQRPQANVVTGLIKSNMPCRVSFKVASGMDSRIVLDQKGAELLLGQGDMLFLTPHTSELVRSQGTLVTDGETRRVAKFLKEVASPSFERQLIQIRPAGAEADPAEDDLGERDPLFDQAVEVMIETGRGSVSLLQRRLAIGYSRASRLVDQMGLAGILGEHRGSVARDVLITMEEWEEMKRLEAAENGELADEADAEGEDAPEADVDPDADADAGEPVDEAEEPAADEDDEDDEDPFEPRSAPIPARRA